MQLILIIVWNPVNYSKQFSTFLMISSIYYFFKYFKSEIINTNIFWNNYSICIFNKTSNNTSIWHLGLFIFLKNYKYPYKLSIKLGIFCLSFLALFTIWPLRNYINHNKVIITKNSDGFKDYDKDVVSFMQYIYCVKTDWDPQYTSIKENKKLFFLIFLILIK